MHDWNHNGKIDKEDRMMDYYIFEETNSDSSGGSNGSSGGGCFTYVIVGVIIIIVLSFLLGVAIPGAVWKLFLNIIGMCLFWGFLSSLKK